MNLLLGLKRIVAILGAHDISLNALNICRNIKCFVRFKFRIDRRNNERNDVHKVVTQV